MTEGPLSSGMSTTRAPRRCCGRRTKLWLLAEFTATVSPARATALCTTPDHGALAQDLAEVDVGERHRLERRARRRRAPERVARDRKFDPRKLDAQPGSSSSRLFASRSSSVAVHRRQRRRQRREAVVREHQLPHRRQLAEPLRQLEQLVSNADGRERARQLPGSVQRQLPGLEREHAQRPSPAARMAMAMATTRVAEQEQDFERRHAPRHVRRARARRGLSSTQACESRARRQPRARSIFSCRSSVSSARTRRPPRRQTARSSSEKRGATTASYEGCN